MGLGGWRRRPLARRLASRPALAGVYDALIPGLIALEPLALVLFGSAVGGARPVDRWTDLDLALLVEGPRRAAQVRRRLRSAARRAGEVVAWGWWGDQALGLLRRDGDLVGLDLHVVLRSRLPGIHRPCAQVLFDPSGALDGWRSRRRPMASGSAGDSADLAFGLAWRARVRVARGDRIEADDLLQSARTALFPALREASGSAPRLGSRGVERDLAPRWRRALAGCRPRDLTSAELLRAVRATFRLAARLR